MHAVQSTAQEKAWRALEFETIDQDGTIARWRWVDKPSQVERGKKVWLLKCDLGERKFQLVKLVKPPPPSEEIQLSITNL